MKTVKIPYLYNLNRAEKYLMLNDINQGITLCRRLGYNPNSIIVGKKELEEVRNFSYHPCIDNLCIDNLGLVLIKSKKKSEFIFCCNELYEFNA